MPLTCPSVPLPFLYPFSAAPSLSSFRVDADTATRGLGISDRVTVTVSAAVSATVSYLTKMGHFEGRRFMTGPAFPTNYIEITRHLQGCALQGGKWGFWGTFSGFLFSISYISY